jgi:4'-phosphopantetheinyl transferase
VASTVRLRVARFTDGDRAEWLASALPILSKSEQERVAAISATDVRAQHAIGRAMVRLIGACATGRSPELLTVTLSDAGKPRLDDAPDLHVSVAHTGRVVAVADSPAAPVGVDIEPVRVAATRQRRLAQRLFSEAEVASVRNLPDAALSDWFSSAWTIKEAVGKALGVGMVPALSGAIVDRQADGVTLAAVWTGPPADSWTIHQLEAPDGSEKIAVALPAAGVQLEPVSRVTLESFSRACALN